MVLQHALQAFLIAGVLAPFSHYAGQAARRLRLPQITGYLISGIIAGPYGLSILSTESVTDLSVIEGGCLAIIGLAAGAELQLAELNRSKQQVVALTAGICVATWALCYVAISWAAALTPVLHVSAGQLAAVASLGATLMMARSPASAIAVLKELDARGPFVSLVMGVVVLKDVVVIVAFAITLELVPLIIDHSSSGVGLAHLLLPVLSVCVSLSAGLLGGALMSTLLHHQLHTKLAALLPAAGGRSLGGAPGGGASQAVAALRCKQAVVLVLSTAVFSVTRALEAEPLLACVTAGMLLANRRLPVSGAHSESSHEELCGLINGIMGVTNVAFFGLAGASLKLSAIADSVWVALLVFLVRLAAIAAGSWAGCRLGNVNSEAARRYFWMSMITQAGVAMGLARIAGTAFADWGPAFQSVMMAIIMVNMLLGPPMFRTALIQVGEARSHALPGGSGVPGFQQQPQGQHHQQQLHRDSSAGLPPLVESVPVVSETGGGTTAYGRHGGAGGKLHTSPLGGGWAQSGSSDSLNGGQAVQLAALQKQQHGGLSGDPAGEGDGHHVVISSQALLGTRHGRSAGAPS